MIIALEALIGAGKTSITNLLAERCNYTKFLEPVEANPFLEYYYKDPYRWAYAMQVNLLFERYKMFQEAHYRSLRGEDCVVDRSYYGDFAFALVQKNDGYFTKNEYKSYVKMHETLQPNLVYPDILIWLELKPEETLERIKKRSRDCEAGIPLEYLQHLYDAYKTVLKSLESRCHIVRIDARPDIETVYANVKKAIDERKEILEHSEHPCYK